MLCVHLSGQDNISLRNIQWEYVATVRTCYIGKNDLPINAHDAESVKLHPMYGCVTGRKQIRPGESH